MTAPPREALEQALAAEPQDSAARFQLASVMLLDDVEPALEQLLEIVRRKGDNAYQAQQGLKALFSMLDAGSPQLKRLRSRFFEFAH